MFSCQFRVEKNSRCRLRSFRFHLFCPMNPSNINLVDVNDDCLLEIFKYCSIESLVALVDVHSRFRGIIVENLFRNKRSHTIEIYCSANFEYFRAGLINHRKIMQNIGQFVRSLTIDIDADTSPMFSRYIHEYRGKDS